jgi:hypothetical protein
MSFEKLADEASETGANGKQFMLFGSVASSVSTHV